ncbi:hypothetical protein [Streptomyces sp. Ncost-T10-10d]|uniref:hypothetical protein n=1 Tax=Streptomyces sp. Ncost-T10-10d TaxID=1839774 RepID=UPI00210C2616|nr:hypothetical protein [Streptomyces sp. Ncost-T10-10d]
MEPVATFCGNCNCGCPQLFVAETAPAERGIVINDDFAQQARMSAGQVGSLVEDAEAASRTSLLRVK